MKTVFTIVLLVVFQLTINAQHTNIWKDGKLTFITKEKVDSEGDEDATDYDAGNDTVGINMEIINYADELEIYLADIKYSSSIGCSDMSLELKKEGSSFLNTHKSFYSICYDKTYNETIINAVIHRDDIKKVYDIALYCYDITLEEGLDVLKSITFLEE
ncbi:MAG: hypothetical protein ACJA1H_001499 [Glaciecola sp.]|jgi:hypothetical protein